MSRATGGNGAARVNLMPGVVAGVGLGGLLDGFLLHQVLGWHHLLSNAIPLQRSYASLALHSRIDGAFDGVMYLLVLVGLGLLSGAALRGRPLAGRLLAGSVLLGLGAWNLFDGTVDHLLLGLHHVREGPDALAYDLGFLAVAVAITGAGLALLRSRRPM